MYGYFFFIHISPTFGVVWRRQILSSVAHGAVRVQVSVRSYYYYYTQNRYTIGPTDRSTDRPADRLGVAGTRQARNLIRLMFLLRFFFSYNFNKNNNIEIIKKKKTNNIFLSARRVFFPPVFPLIIYVYYVRPSTAELVASYTHGCFSIHEWTSHTESCLGTDAQTRMYTRAAVQKHNTSLPLTVYTLSKCATIK